MTTKFPVPRAATVEGEDATEKSAAFVPEIIALEIFNVFVVPRFSTVKVVGDIVETAEVIVCVPPERIVVVPCFTLISCAGVAAPTAIFTSSKPIFPETLFV